MRRFGIIFASLPSDRGCCPRSGGAGDTQDREPGKVACCCEELEVLVHPDLAAHARSSPAVAAAHAVGLLALLRGSPWAGWRCSRPAIRDRPGSGGPPAGGLHAR